MPHPSEFVFRHVPTKLDAEIDSGSGPAPRSVSTAFTGSLSVSESALRKNSRANRDSVMAGLESRLEARDDEQTFAQVGLQHDGRRVHRMGCRERNGIVPRGRCRVQGIGVSPSPVFVCLLANP